MQVLDVSISRPRPHPRNTRQHPEENIKAIMASLSKFGQQVPIVLGESDYIIKGNGTFEAAKRLGWRTVKAVISPLKSEDQLAFSVADNKTGESSVFDYVALSEVIRELDRAEFDLGALGFQEFELKPLLSEDWAPRDVPEPEQGEMGVVMRVKFEEQDATVIRLALARHNALTEQEDRVETFLASLCRSYIRENTRPAPKKKGG